MNPCRSVIRVCHLIAAAALLAAPVPALAYPAGIVPADARQADKPILVQVIIPQVEVRLPIAGAGGGGEAQGGIVGALIVGAMDASKQKKVQDAAEPIRIALEDFSADPVAMEATRKAFGALPWVKIADGAPSRNPTMRAGSALLDRAPGAHAATLTYQYMINPGYTGASVIATIAMAAKDNPKAKTPEKRWLPERLSYRNSVSVSVSLSNMAATEEERQKQWGANDGALARAVLSKALNKAAELAARSMALTAVDLLSLNAKDRPKTTAGFVKGRIVEGGENIATPATSNALVRMSATVKPDTDGLLVWADFFLHMSAVTAPNP